MGTFPCISSAFFPWWAGSLEKSLYKLYISTDTPEKLLERALTSNDPEKVEICLDKLIEMKNYLYIFRVKIRVENIIRNLRKNLMLSQKPLSPEKIQKELKPWLQIQRKAQYFFTRKETLSSEINEKRQSNF